MADFLDCWNQMPGDKLMNYSTSGVCLYKKMPAHHHNDVYSTIDVIPHGGEPWSKFSMKYSGMLPESKVPPWMLASYDVHFHNPCTISDFKSEIDHAPLCEFGLKNEWIWLNFMSGNWAWSQGDIIAKDPQEQCLSLVFQEATR